MSHVSIVFLVELGERGVELGRLLTRAGFDARAISAIEIGNALDHILPAVIVCPHVHADSVAKALRGRPGSTEITWFATAPESAGPHVKGSLPREVTAVVRDDIDPGILSLRLKAATQQAPGPRAMAQTLMGVIAPTDGPALQGPGSVPPPSVTSASRSVAPAPQSVFPSGQSQPAASSSPVSSMLPAPQSVAPAPQSVAPAPQFLAPAPQSVAPAPQSVAPAPSSHPFAGSSALLNSSVSNVAPAPPSVPPSAPSVAPIAQASVPTVAHPPGPHDPASTASVVMSNAVGTDHPFGTSPSTSKKKKIALTAAAVVVLGGGATFWVNTPPKVSVQAASIASAEAKSTPAPIASSAAAAVEPKPPEPAPAISAPALDAPSPGELYKIAQVTTIDDCDKVLEKPATYYSKQPKWKAATYWKSARRYLTLGKDELAFSQMCQAVSVDPASQALGGLVNYFLRHRALNQAQAWAERGIAASKNNRTAKDALGDTLSQLGKVDEARALWLETAKLTEDKKTKMQAVARNWLKLAKKSQKGGDSWLAERLLRRAAAFDGENAEVAATLAVTLQKNEQSELAKNWAERAISLDSESKEVKALLAQLK